LIGDTTDSRPWKNRSVTFVEKHDTGYRTDENGQPQAGHERDNFLEGWPVEQAYAQILTHPGIPTVYWKHYFDWGRDLQDKIQALINARKVAAINCASEFDLQNNARQRGVHGARVVGRNGVLFVRVGGADEVWNPGNSGYQDYREYAAGIGWRVWVQLNGTAANGEFQWAPLNGALPVPKFEHADGIVVRDEELQ
jgi:alpha-amylase